MAQTITKTQARKQIGVMWRRIQRGETVTVTHHGKPIALISPIDSATTYEVVGAGDVDQESPVVRL